MQSMVMRCVWAADQTLHKESHPSKPAHNGTYGCAILPDMGGLEQRMRAFDPSTQCGSLCADEWAERSRHVRFHVCFAPPVAAVRRVKAVAGVRMLNDDLIEIRV
jgi:hypothetical protein